MIFLIKVFIVVNSEPGMLCTGTGGINNNNIVEYCRLRLASTSTTYDTTTQQFRRIVHQVKFNMKSLQKIDLEER